MKEKPILFKTEMVNALLDGKKSQTRRIVKKLDGNIFKPCKGVKTNLDNDIGRLLAETSFCPYGTFGDQLWVKETFWYFRQPEERGFKHEVGKNWIFFKADDPPHLRNTKWYSPLHMPRWASRIDLLIKDIRMERLCAISESDAIAEGFSSIQEFANYIDIINGKGTWNKNPWVWVIEFERIGGGK